MRKLIVALMLLSVAFGCTMEKREKITIYTIGDSTVRNGRGDGLGGLWGWGDPFVQYFDTSKVEVKNHAMGGTSTRTYRAEGLWQEVLDELQPGDYVFMQFGHNDAGALNDTLRARGTIRGAGDESEEIDNMLTGKHETVHSYGWYLRQFVKETRAKGAIPIIVSPIPRNVWKGDKVPRNNQDYGKWAKEIADEEGVDFINLNEAMASAMEQLGEENVTGNLFYRRDHTHTSAQGAVLASSLVVEGLKQLETCPLKNYLLSQPQIVFPVKKKTFLIGDSTVAQGNNGKIGWGRFLQAQMDTARMTVVNKARGGRSSRSYCYEGLWQEVLDQMRAGDFLIIQFGHNDSGHIDTPKYRGSIPGMSDSCVTVQREDGEEIVHTYGWYLKKYITEAKAKGVDVIVLSHIPRNKWSHGKVERNDQGYGKWAKEAAVAAGAHFIDFNDIIARRYEAMGQEDVAKFFPADHTHTTAEGAQLNAEILAESIQQLRASKLRRYLK